MKLMEHLKTATQTQHRALEQQLDLIGRPWSQAEYAELLGRMLGLYEPLENHLLASPLAALFPLDDRLKAPLLEADLTDLKQDATRFRRCTALPATQSLPEALGVLYVLEGATLGGQLISRHLQSTLGIAADYGGRFYASYGPAVGQMWREFKQFANAQPFDAADYSTAADNANTTFDLFRHWTAAGASA